MPSELREELAALADEEWVRELADDEYLDERSPQYNVALSAVIPEDADPLDWDMVEAHGIDDDLHERIMALAGANVSAHDVVRHFVIEAKRKHQTGEWVSNGGTGTQTTDDTNTN